MKRTVNDKPILLPAKFKYAGLILVLLSALIAIIMRQYYSGLVSEIHWLKPILKCSILIGFITIMLSKEKVEDEFIMQCRLRAFLFAFLFGIVHYIGNIFFKELAGELNDSAFSILCSQSVMFLGWFHLTIRQYN